MGVEVVALELYKQNHFFVQSDLNGEASYGLIPAGYKTLYIYRTLCNQREYISYTSATYSTIAFINATKAGENEREGAGGGCGWVSGWVVGEGGWRHRTHTNKIISLCRVTSYTIQMAGFVVQRHVRP